MDRLPLHIEYLLTRHDCVILPGIGAFIATETEACLDRARATVSARKREISFNGSVVTDDGLLSHSIARRERLCYEEAHRLLDILTSRMRRELEAEGETSIGRVGKLIRGVDGAISFSPRRQILDSEIRRDLTVSNKQPKSEAPIVEVGPLRPTPAVASEGDRYVFSVSKRLVHAAAAIALILTVCLSVLVPSGHVEEQRASVMPIEDFLRRPLVIEVDPASDVSTPDSASSAGEDPTLEASFESISPSNE